MKDRRGIEAQLAELLEIASTDESDERERLQAERSALRRSQPPAPPKPPLPPPGGGGTPGGMSDEWKASVDTQLARLHSDLRLLVGWLVAAISVPLLAIIGLYVYIGNQSNAIETRIVGVDRTVSSVQVEQAKTNGKIDMLLERTSPKK